MGQIKAMFINTGVYWTQQGDRMAIVITWIVLQGKIFIIWVIVEFSTVLALRLQSPGEVIHCVMNEADLSIVYRTWNH